MQPGLFCCQHSFSCSFCSCHRCLRCVCAPPKTHPCSDDYDGYDEASAKLSSATKGYEAEDEPYSGPEVGTVCGGGYADCHSVTGHCLCCLHSRAIGVGSWHTPCSLDAIVLACTVRPFPYCNVLTLFFPSARCACCCLPTIPCVECYCSTTNLRPLTGPTTTTPHVVTMEAIVTLTPTTNRAATATPTSPSTVAATTRTRTTRPAAAMTTIRVMR